MIQPMGGIFFNEPLSYNYKTIDDLYLQFSLNDVSLKKYHTALFNKAFSTQDLKRIPVSWGKSEKTLIEKMTLVSNFDGIKPIYSDVVSEDDSFVVNGDDPKLIFDLSGSEVSGRNADFIRFNFSCPGASSEPRLQIFFWGDDYNSATENLSVKFTAVNGVLIVPLYSSSWWVNLDKVNGLRIDLDNPNTCNKFNLSNVGIYSRNVH